MARKEKKYHFIYKTTNLLNGKYYIGMHSTDNLEDGYMGSGKRLRYSINKHGKVNHKVEILEFVTTRKELAAREKELVSVAEIVKQECMNLKIGGDGGGELYNSLEKMKEISVLGNNKLRELRLTDEVWRQRESETRSLRLKKEFESGIRVNFKFDWTGKKHSEETKIKMRKTKFVGEENPQFGTCWINKDGVDKKIKKEFIESFIKNGWQKGRVKKYKV